ncbi:60S ribosomal protein L21 [Cucumispora dikerogammari]|nr:60S ribosomal protein L21 [Cucumispora dikerogammari]
MVSSNGFRRKTRKLLKQSFRKHGVPSATTYLQSYKVGDLVDVFINPAIQKGMPHKYYHGRTGKIITVNVRSMIVLFYKRVGGRYIEKTVTIKVDHLRKSKSRDDYLKRQFENNILKIKAKKEGKPFVFPKRQPEGPRPSFCISLDNNIPQIVNPKPHVSIY